MGSLASKTSTTDAGVALDNKNTTATAATATAATTTSTVRTPACKICCACPTERRARDECLLLKGTEACTAQLDAFYRCLLREGFAADEVNALRRNATTIRSL